MRDRAGEVTYGELAAAAARAGGAVGGMRRVALLPRADAASLAVVLGAMGAGVSVVLLHRHVTAEGFARVLEVARPGTVVGRVSGAGALRSLCAAERVSSAERLAWEEGGSGGPSRRPGARGAARAGGGAEPAGGDAAGVLGVARPGDELLVGLTSGTSGEPKLFVRDQASWAATLDRSDAAFDVRPGDRVSIPGPLDHTHFLYGALHALTRGAAVDLRPLREAFAAGEPLPGAPAPPASVLAGAGPTHVYLVPTLAADLAALLDGRPRPAVREVASSSADWAPEARARLAALLPNAEILHFYGASELSFVALDRWPAITADLGVNSTLKPAVIEAERGAGAVGEPFPGVEVDVRDGIVHVRSDMLFSGYLADDGTLTGGPDPDGWLTVGDRGALRDGRLFLAGRASETVVYGGLKVEPAEVERALAGLPGIADLACVGLPDERMGAVPVVAIVLTAAAAPAQYDAAPAPAAAAPPPPLTRAAVRRHARVTLPQPSRPHRVFVLDALPRTPRGKLDRTELARRLAAGEADELT